jgi:hypothetical protein
MITTLTTLWGLLGGGIMRLLPELMAFFNKKTDNGHELAMMDKQIELENLRASSNRQTLVDQGEQERATIEVKGNEESILAYLDAQKEALKGQMQITGNKWADALNFLVRPVVTYYFVLLYGFIKLAMIVIAFHQADQWQAVIGVWSSDDAGILSGILGFWFVGRVFDKKGK